jgi:hypothetical protein
VLLTITLLALSLVSIRKENRHGQPLNRIIWFSLAIIASCALIALLAGYEQTARSLERVSHRVERVSSPRVVMVCGRFNPALVAV